jgi:phosphonate transport system permease protein
VIVGSRLATLSRLLANVVRSIPAIFWAILFVILVGPGPRAGALALSLYTAAYLAKFFYEILESVDREHVNSLKVMGLSGLTLASALYAHTRRQVVSSILFMLEYNVRTATIIGFVGAGGVGYYILHYMNSLDYPAVITFIAVTTLFVIAIDTLSYLVRTRV